MKIKGSLSEVQSNIDFYLSVSSVGNIKTTKDLRKHFFKRFLQEEREQMDTLLKEKIELELQKEKELQEAEELKKQKEQERLLLLEKQKLKLQKEKELQEAEELKRQKEQEKLLLLEKQKLEIQKEKETQEEENQKLETVSIFDELLSSMDFSDNPLDVLNDSTTPDNSDAIKEPEVLVDESHSPFNSKFFLEAVSKRQPPEEIEVKDFVDHGIYLEGLVYDDSNESEEEQEEYLQEELIHPTSEFVEHGVMLDELDYCEEDDSEDEDCENTTNLEQVCFVSHGILLDEIEYDLNTSDEEEDYQEEQTEYYEGFEDSYTEEYTIESSEQSVQWENLIEEDVLEDEIPYIQSETYEESQGIQQEEVKQNVNNDTGTAYASEPREVSKKEDPIEVPKDIRAFLRQHPNSDISFVLKYYPKKEVEKQIKLGRIYKKKGILMI